MCDWNNNGKYDMHDTFISYHIHRSISGDSQNHNSSGNGGDGGRGCALMLMLAVFAMPFLGIYLAVSGEDEGQKLLGVTLFIVGLIAWIKIGVSV